jgi:hypothetical protein
MWVSRRCCCPKLHDIKYMVSFPLGMIGGGHGQKHRHPFRRNAERDLEKAHVRLDPLGEPHDSMNFTWCLLEYLPRRVPETSWWRRGKAKEAYLPLADHRFVPEGASIHQSVLDREYRKTRNSPYAPPDFPTSFETEPWSSDATAGAETGFANQSAGGQSPYLR